MAVTGPLNLRPPPNWCIATNDAPQEPASCGELGPKERIAPRVPPSFRQIGQGCVSYPRDVEAAGLPAVSRIARPQTYPGRRCACGPRWSSSPERSRTDFLVTRWTSMTARPAHRDTAERTNTNGRTAAPVIPSARGSKELAPYRRLRWYPTCVIVDSTPAVEV